MDNRIVVTAKNMCDSPLFFCFAGLTVFDLDDLMLFGFTDRLTGDFFDFFFLDANTMCET